MTDLEILAQVLKKIPKTKNLTSFKKVGYYGLWSEKNSYSMKGDKINGLNLNGNQLSILPNEISKLSQLRWLDLSKNQLTNLPNEITQLSKLKLLYLNKNELTTLPIEITQLFQLEMLELTGNQLTNLPNEIVQLSELKKLQLSNNQLSVFPNEIINLSKLESLDLSRNELTKLPRGILKLSNLEKLDLNYNQLKNLPNEISQLHRLSWLFLVQNKLTTLPKEISQLSNLNWLMLNSNQLTTLPEEITGLSKLNRLNLASNQLTKLPKGIIQSTELKSLTLSDNQLTVLPNEIAHLTQLEKLDLSNNQLKVLPKEAAKLSSLKQLNLRKNQFKIPNRIYHKLPEEQIRFLLVKEQSKIPLNEGKMIVLGNAQVGKTALIEQLVKNTFSGTTQITEGISITPWQIDDEVQVNIWDFGEQGIMYTMHQFFMTKRTLYVLVDKDNSSGKSLEDWLSLITIFGRNSPVLIVASHSDLHDLNIDKNRLKKKYPNILGFYRTSAKTAQGIDTLRKKIKSRAVYKALKHIKKHVPTKWIRVKEALVQLQITKNYIDLQEYYQLCESKELKSEQQIKELLILLHDLGVSFNFYGSNSKLEDTNILKPEWITKKIYAMINNKNFLQKAEIEVFQ